MWTTFFAAEPVTDWTTANNCDREQYARFFHAILDEGVYLAPSQFEAAFVSAAHTEKIIDMTVEAAEKAFNTIRD